MISFDEARFTRLVSDRGLGDATHAHRAIMATLQALGAHIPAPEREALARALPLKLARAVSAERYRGHGKVEDLYAAVARSERTAEGRAREHVQIVLGALGEVMSPELEQRELRVLTPSIAELVRGVAGSEGEPAPYAEVHSERHHTLATGKPGSAHPISASAPAGAQTESVAARNPHADTKLSSAHGETQERERESLADAEPRTERTIAESHD